MLISFNSLIVDKLQKFETKFETKMWCASLGNQRMLLFSRIIRQCDVMTSHRRQYGVISKSCAHWIIILNIEQKPKDIETWQWLKQWTTKKRRLGMVGNELLWINYGIGVHFMLSKDVQKVKWIQVG